MGTLMHARFLGTGVRALPVLSFCLVSLAWPALAGAESPTPSHADTPATTETTPEDIQPSIQEPEYSLDEEDHATAAELEAVEPPAPIASEPSTEVPPAEALLQLKPLNGTTARFTDLLTPPAEVVQEEASAQDQESDEATAYNVPIVLDPSVQGHIRFFNVSIRNRFEQWLIRLSHYRPLVDSIFSEFQLPSDLIYLSLVESGFNPHAYSRARAAGPWQFMKGTAKVYGLRVDSYVDERRDPVKSTVAAARYLRDLYDLFGTWPLAMAAYNAGEGKVMRALHTAQAESFSDIAKTRLIRRETKEYVPRFMAATIIAKKARIREKVEQLLDRAPTHKFAPLPVPVRVRHVKPEPESGHWYRVRVGDSLERIAKRFNISVKTLKSNNNLTGPTIKAGSRLVIAN